MGDKKVKIKTQGKMQQTVNSVKSLIKLLFIFEYRNFVKKIYSLQFNPNFDYSS